ncbi:MAG: dephospho-CoA kinase [bacterium]|nr:dephospho-CoA kinase [bacterium]
MRPDGNTRRPLRLIVSGGIGAGKTTVLRMLESLGAVVVEVDRIGHEVLEPDGVAFEEVSRHWPSVVVDGRISRPLLASIVFSDSEQLSHLEALTHPAIRNEIAARVAAAGDRDVVLELPLRSQLAGPGWTRLVVDAPTRVRQGRAVARGMADNDVANRIQAQPDRDQWLAGADYVIDNFGSIEELEAAVEAVWQAVKSASDL